MITVLRPADKNKITTSPGLGIFGQKSGKLGHWSSKSGYSWFAFTRNVFQMLLAPH